MPKRPASTGILCPGCSANFDTETHIPFMGSCGDSLCAVCVNEKKIKTCPVCNRRSFAWKQSNNLAMELLAEKEAENSKKSKLDVETVNYAPGEPVPAILDPENLPFLVQIVNQLDPTSFLNFASTCKTLHDYCFNCKDVKIIYNSHKISVKMERDRFVFDIRERLLKLDDRYSYREVFVPSAYALDNYGFLSSATGRKKLRNYPFEFKLGELEFHEVNRFDEAFFTLLRTFFSEFPIKVVTSVGTPYFSDWNFQQLSEGFLQFLKDFRIVEVNFGHAQFAQDVSDEALNYLLLNTESFSAYKMKIPERFLLNASVPTLRLSISISNRTFVDLIKKFADSTDEIYWYLRCESFELQDALRPFKLLPFDHEGPLPDEHPIIFVKDELPQECWLLRKDGKVLTCDAYFGISLRMCFPCANYPPCLRRSFDDSEEESEPNGNSDDESESEGGDESSD